LFRLRSRGSFDNTEAFLKAMEDFTIDRQLDRYAQEGMFALAATTPRDSGITAQSWGYQVRRQGTNVTITWTNDSKNGGFPIAIMLQYGHGTGTGGYVSGRDYINPTMRPVFDAIADGVWKEVRSA